jgi:hypothetical protein
MHSLVPIVLLVPALVAVEVTADPLHNLSDKDTAEILHELGEQETLLHRTRDFIFRLDEKHPPIPSLLLHLEKVAEIQQAVVKRLKTEIQKRAEGGDPLILARAEREGKLATKEFALQFVRKQLEQLEIARKEIIRRELEKIESQRNVLKANILNLSREIDTLRGELAVKPATEAEH